MKKNNTSDELDLTPIDQELDASMFPPAEDDGEKDEQDPSFSLQSRRDERQVAFYLLYAIDRSEYSLSIDEVVRAFERGFEAKIPKSSFAYRSVKDIAETHKELDEFLTPFLKNWRLERLGCCTHLILLLSLWELQQAGAIGSVVINEAVELAKTFAEKDAYKFINGILDEVAKKIIEASPSETPVKKSKTKE
jgi:N utilization substance protein B